MSLALLLSCSARALCDIIQPGAPDQLVGKVLPAQKAGAPAGLVFVPEGDPETSAIVPLVGSFNAPVSVGDVILCEGDANADHTGCADPSDISDVVRFTKGAAGANQYQFQVFSDPDSPEGGLDLTKLPGGLQATTYYIGEKFKTVDASAFVPGLTAVPVVVYKADDGSGNTNTYWIVSDANVPEPSTILLLATILGVVFVAHKVRRYVSPTIYTQQHSLLSPWVSNGPGSSS